MSKSTLCVRISDRHVAWLSKQKEKHQMSLGEIIRHLIDEKLLEEKKSLFKDVA